MVCFRYIIVNTLQKADDDDEDDSDNLVSVHIHVLVKLAQWPKLEVKTSCQMLITQRAVCDW